MDLKNESSIIVGFRLEPKDVKNLKLEAKKRRLTLSGLIRERIFKDEVKTKLAE